MCETNEELLKEVFDILDKDHNGYLNLMEFGNAVRAIGLNPTESEITEILKENDMDRDGVISFDEFNKMYRMVKIGHEFDKNEAQNIYEMYSDKTGGTITVNQFREILKGEGEPLTDEQIEIIIKDFDSDDTGILNLKDLVEVLKN